MKSFISHFYFIFAGISTNLIGNGRSKESSWSKNHCEDFQTGFIFYNMNTKQLKKLFGSDYVSKERKNQLNYSYDKVEGELGGRRELGEEG